MKKLLIILSAILLCISPFFTFHNDNKLIVSAVYDNTYEYTATISTDYSTTFLEGIDSIDKVSFDYLMHYQISYSTPVPFKFIIDCGSNFNYSSSFTEIVFKLNRYYKPDYTFEGLTSSIALYGSFKTSYDYGYAQITGTLSKVIISDCYVIQSTYGTTSPYPNTNNSSTGAVGLSYRHYEDSSENLSYYLDLDSNTNYSYNIADILDFTYQEDYYNPYDFFTFNGGDRFYCGNILDNVSKFELSICTGSNIKNTDVSESAHYYFTLDFRFTDSNFSNYSYNLDYNGCVLNNFEIIVNRPVNRLDNTLVLYNYNYDSAISSVSSVEYALSKDNDLYKAKYTGALPNNRYIGIVSGELQNRIYDEYIYIYLTFKNNRIDFNNNGAFTLGFDFNFSRYYEPFVIKESDLNNYNLPTLNKPDDWYDFGGWIRYAFIWLLFYNPVIAPISKFIVSIFGVFINVFKFILGFELGTFILAFIGFVVIYNFFVSISPIQKIGKGISVLDDTLENEYADYKGYREKIKPERVHKKKVIKRAKRVNKIKKENFKKLKEIHDTKSIRK